MARRGPGFALTSARIVRRTPKPDELAALAEDARGDGQRMVDALVAELSDGTNRFDRPGERFYVAELGGEIVGVCGLNRDPYAGDGVGRVRRLYVAVGHRRRGIASRLLAELVRDAAGDFRELHVRTYGEGARVFYARQGFDAVLGDEFCTHRRALS